MSTLVILVPASLSVASNKLVMVRIGSTLSCAEHKSKISFSFWKEKSKRQVSAKISFLLIAQFFWIPGKPHICSGTMVQAVLEVIFQVLRDTEDEGFHIEIEWIQDYGVWCVLQLAFYRVYSLFPRFSKLLFLMDLTKLGLIFS